MSFIKNRLRRLEGHIRGGDGRCQACGLPPDGPGRIVYIDDGIPGKGFPDDPEERCGSCGRPLWTVIKVVYGDTPEGEGAVADA